MCLKVVICIIALTLCTCNIFDRVVCEVNSRSSRIARGYDVAIEDFPFIVSVQVAFGVHICGGSMIHPLWVLTAAHCVSIAPRPTLKLNTTRDPVADPAKRLVEINTTRDPVVDPAERLVVAGLSEVTTNAVSKADPSSNQDNPHRRKVTEIIRHEDYESITDVPKYWHDIALMKLESSFGKELSVQVVTLAPPEFVEPADCVTIGWGKQPRSPEQCSSDLDPSTMKTHLQRSPEQRSSNLDPSTMKTHLQRSPAEHSSNLDPSTLKTHLQAVEVIITDRSYCAKAMFKTTLYKDHQLCADTRESSGGGICAGDSGSPLVKDGVQLGISSYMDSTHKPCSDNPYVIFTRVAKYRDWIDKHVP